jgi:uracil-DNA glycosylase
MKREHKSASVTQRELDQVLSQVRARTVCADSLPYSPKPILSVSATTKILVIGQAPGARVHEAEIPWQDKSGEILCSWMGISRSRFSDNALIGTMPMGFCFPGSKEGGGDLPPRPECAPLWHQEILTHLREVQLMIFIGQYAIQAYLKPKLNLTETVRRFRDYLPERFPIVHPSPLNFRWQVKNKWFAEDVIPELQNLVQEIVGTT